MNAQEWKQLISAYVDDALSPEDKVVAEKLLAERPECRIYLEELRRLSSSLHVLTDETLSPDAELKILSKVKKERSMQTYQWKAPATVAATILVVVLAYNSLTSRTYLPQLVKEDGAWKVQTAVPVLSTPRSAPDDIGDQYSASAARFIRKSPGKTAGTPSQYEPYYQKAEKSGTAISGEKIDAGKASGEYWGQAANKPYEKKITGPSPTVLVEGASRNENLKTRSQLGAARSLSDGSGLASESNYSLKKDQYGRDGRIYAQASTGGGMAYSVDKEVPAARSVRSFKTTEYERAKQGIDYRKGYTAPAAEATLQYEPYYMESVPRRADYDMKQNYGDESGAWTYYAPDYDPQYYQHAPSNTEEYKRMEDNPFLSAVDNPLSTLSADVDTASYSNVRRYLTQRQMPPRDSVRIEELINYFSYEYPQPPLFQPFSITTDLAVCPWNQGHQLLRVGLKGKIPAGFTLPPSNLVFLIDVSGSMSDEDKLPLLKEGFKMMVQQLRPQDYVSIVVYAGHAGEVLSPTSGADKGSILSAIDSLQAGGSTAGGAGIRLAYQIAKQNFIKGGNNRIILATDGDFNVGVSDTAELTRMIEEKRREGVFLTILGFGQDNLKDSRMMQLADNGNGNYFYIDNLQEAQKVLVNELGSTLFTIAKDVKIQIEFNPASVKAYRLIGYEKRVLAKEDFNNDRKDAGEIGAGHTVTALYEIVPAGPWSAFESTPKVDPLKYQSKPKVIFPNINSNEVATVKLRYKEPNGDASKLLSRTVKRSDYVRYPSGDFAWASAVAEFGMLLRGSEYRGQASYEHALNIARSNIGNDPQGMRSEFITLIEIARDLDPQPQPRPVWREDSYNYNDYQEEERREINFK